MLLASAWRRSKPGAEVQYFAGRQQRAIRARGPCIDFLARTINHPEAKPRYFCQPAGGADDVALDDQHRLAVFASREWF